MSPAGGDAGQPLSLIQAHLSALYDVSVGLEVGDFVCSPAAVEQAAGLEAARGELLLVAEDEGDVAVGLYVNPAAVDQLSTSEGKDVWLQDRTFSAACLATEGVSHFLYLAFRIQNEVGVSQLELEIQAEVDKYASALLAGQGMGAVRERSRVVRHRLFKGATFIDAADTERGQRYRLAHEVGARYARGLEERHLGRGDVTGFQRELRRFYRRGLRGKLEAVA